MKPFCRSALTILLGLVATGCMSDVRHGGTPGLYGGAPPVVGGHGSAPSGHRYGWSPFFFGQDSPSSLQHYGSPPVVYRHGSPVIGVARPTSRDDDRRRDADAVFEPRPGVVCNAERKVCRDRQGPELSLTREIFGNKAARRLEEDIGGKWRKDDRYAPAKRVRCDVGDEICLRRGEPDYRQTRAQFGREAALGTASESGKVKPRRKVRCDVDDRVCVKNGKVAIDATRSVFGKKAAKQARRADRTR